MSFSSAFSWPNLLLRGQHNLQKKVYNFRKDSLKPGCVDAPKTGEWSEVRNRWVDPNLLSPS
jgi:hypothetical protein